MDDTDTNQEASSQSSNEDTPRPIDLRAIGSPTFAPLSPIQIERSPPEEETKRESPKSETETPVRRLYSTPLRGDPPSPLPPFEEPEPPTMSGPPTVEELEATIAALPTKAEYDAMVKEIELLKDLLAKVATARGTGTSTTTTSTYKSSAVITDPDDFQRSPYAQPAPFDLTSKSGLLLYTDAQEALKVPLALATVVHHGLHSQ